MARAQTQYKDRLFSFIFGSDEHKDWTLSLYNAVNGSSYDDPESIVITTIRDALYLGMHNDVSFIISNEMNMFEQVYENAPLGSRGAFIGLILAFASGFRLLLTLYAGLLIMFPFPCFCENAITSSLALKTAQRAFQ